MNLGFLKYISLGFEVFNAVTTIVALVKTPALLDAATVWGVVEPVISEVADVAKVKVNLQLAQQITNDAVNTIKAALVKK